jgi:hypothetical protein
MNNYFVFIALFSLSLQAARHDFVTRELLAHQRPNQPPLRKKARFVLAHLIQGPKRTCSVNNEAFHELFPLLESCYTLPGAWGLVALARYYNAPTTKISHLQKQQARIQDLLANKEQLDTLVQTFSALAPHQEAITLLLDEHNQLYSPLVETLFYGGSFHMTAQPYKTECIGLGIAAACTGIQGHLYSEFFAGTEVDMQNPTSFYFSKLSLISNIAMLLLGAGILGKVVLEKKDLLKVLTKHLLCLKPLLTHAQTVHNTLLEFDSFRQITTTLQQLLQALDPLKTQQPLEQIPFLLTNLPTLGLLIQTLAECEMYSGLAQTMHTAKTPWCFTQFKKQERPLLSFDNGFYPLVSNPSLASLSFGESVDSRGALITGANATGKSVILKTALAVCLMSQTFGIAPAGAATLTPFKHIACLAHQADSLTRNTSLFESEVKMMTNLIKKVTNNKTRGATLFVCDELFTSTDPQSGQALAYECAHYLSTFPHICSLFATHYEKMTALEAATNGVFCNYYTEKNNAGVYSFSRGISRQESGFTLCSNAHMPETFMAYASEVWRQTATTDPA